MFRKCSVNQQQEYLYCDGASYGSRPPQREVPPTNPLLLVVDLTCWTAAVTVSPIPLGSHHPSVTAGAPRTSPTADRAETDTIKSRARRKLS